MSRSEKLSFDDTKRLLDHACGSSPTMTAARVADYLEIPSSRVSEGRRKEWRLSQELSEKLMSRFGQPKAKPGLFVRAEQRDCIESFLELEDATSQKRHFSRVRSLFYSSEFRNELADTIKSIGEDDQLLIPADLFAEDGDENLGLFELGKVRKERARKKFTSKEFRNNKLDRLFSLMRDPLFGEWSQIISDIIKSKIQAGLQPDSIKLYLSATGFYAVNDILNIDPKGNNNHLSTDNSLEKLGREFGLDISGVDKMSLFLIGRLDKHFLEHENLASDKSADLSLREYVISGDLIWSYEGRFTSPKQGSAGLPCIYFPADSDDPAWTPPLLSGFDDYKYGSKNHSMSLCLDAWTTYEVSLFLKENCDYALLISLGSSDEKGSYLGHMAERNIVIPNIAGLSLFKELEQLRKWLGLPELPEDEMKTSIAKFGGYVPGALVI
ncbi:hypothetical protein [uncultured Neptuniibacter sp.]|uniref:hypothetical protein n=1 Tax=uncultured Neptuniibacter sp. TaxID=502143 RepID=UPI00262AA58A|nr:hypothetical protein [uncultured Neptuniibacter sp.]